MYFAFRIDDRRRMDRHLLKFVIACNVVICEVGLAVFKYQITEFRNYKSPPAVSAAPRAHRSRHQPASHRRLGRHFAVHVRFAFEPRRRHAPRPYFHFNPQLIARHHRTPEPCLLDSRKHHQHLVAIRNLRQQQQPASLRNRLHDQHARHDRLLRKVSLKKWFRDRHILQRNDPLHAHQFQHAIDQQKREAMRQNLEDVANFHAGFHRLRLVGRRVCGVSHADSFKPKIIL